MATTKITWSWGSSQNIDFNAASDKLDFGWFGADNFTLADTDAGVLISIPSNDQRYLLKGVTLSQLSVDRNIMALDAGAAAAWAAAIARPTTASLSAESPTAEYTNIEIDADTASSGAGNAEQTAKDGVVRALVSNTAGTAAPSTSGSIKTTTISWRWGQTINVDASQFSASNGDKLDFGWFQAGNFKISEENGSVTISIPSNNQKYVLDGVHLSDLTMRNISALDASALLAWRVALGESVTELKGEVAGTGASGSGAIVDPGTTAGGTDPSSGATSSSGTESSPTNTGAANGTGAYAPGWTANKVYHGGDTASINGKVYVAGWWTQGEDPGSSASVVWKFKGYMNTNPVLADAPDDLGVTALKATSAVLKWDAATVNGFGTVSKYNVYLGDTLIGSTTNTYLKLTDLTAGTNYALTVTAVDEAGESAHSNAFALTTAAAPVSNGGSHAAQPADDTYVPGLVDTRSGETLTGVHEQYFAPYIDMSLSSSQNLVDLARQSGIHNFTLAFVLSAGANTHDVHWGGYASTSIADDTLWNGSATIKGNIDAIQAMGGDITISFGGANGVEAAVQMIADKGSGQITNDDVRALANAYESVITRYNVHRLDFDVEGAALPNNSANVLRAKAIALLQSEHANLEIGYTLPVMPDGLTYDGVNLLKVSKANGVKIDVVSIMAMDYGQLNDDMGQAAIDATMNTLAQVRSLGLDSRIGIIPMIGVNDTTGNTGKEIFTLEDAEQLIDFASGNPDISHVSMWSLGRDHGGSGLSPSNSGLAIQNYEFSRIFSTI